MYAYVASYFLQCNLQRKDLIECMGASTNDFIVKLFKQVPSLPSVFSKTNHDPLPPLSQDVKYGEVLNKESLNNFLNDMHLSFGNM